MSITHRPDGGRQRYFGLYPAIVTDLEDPERLGRVALRFPWLGAVGAEARAWATLLSPYADDDQGLQVLPEVDSQVVVGFEAGNLRRPYVVGACWNGREALPETPTAANDLRLLRTRSGSELRFDDATGGAEVTLQTADGHRVVLDAGGQTITVAHANGAEIVLQSSGAIEIRANSTVEVHASTVNVHAPVANFDGIVKCSTLIADSGVVSPSYTPGAGNVW